MHTTTPTPGLITPPSCWQPAEGPASPTSSMALRACCRVDQRATDSLRHRDAVSASIVEQRQTLATYASSSMRIASHDICIEEPGSCWSHKCLGAVGVSMA